MPNQHGRLYPVYVITGYQNYITAHELGLGHSENQSEVGSCRFARGHSVEQQFHPVMSLGTRGGFKSSVFSNPEVEGLGYFADTDYDDDNEGVPNDEDSESLNPNVS